MTLFLKTIGAWDILTIQVSVHFMNVLIEVRHILIFLFCYPTKSVHKGPLSSQFKSYSGIFAKHLFFHLLKKNPLLTYNLVYI